MPTPQAGLAEIWQALLASAAHRRVAHATLGPEVLRPLAQVLASLGDPHLATPSVHIAGSKGKGSTATFLERLLAGAGLATGAFTSPHFERWNERVRLRGEPAPVALLGASFQRLEAALAAHPCPAEVRFFDRLFALACEAFAREGVDWALIEAGIGGRVDATNLVAPRLSVVTGVEREHCDVLGDSLAQIASEKAGIVKTGVAVLIGTMPDEARRVIAARARRQDAPLIEATGRSRYVSAPGGRSEVEYHGACTYRFVLPAPDAAAVANATLALAACEHLGIPVTGSGLDALALPLPGRCEWLAGPPAVLLDNAHTPASMANLTALLRRRAPRRLHLVIGLSDHRHLATTAALLAPQAARVVATRADTTYSLAPETLAGAFRAAGATDVVVEGVLEHALAAAGGGLGERDLLCVTGSTYLVGRARALLRAAPAG